MKSFIYLMHTPDFDEIFKRGWGNGYVALLKGHKYFEIDYNEIDVSVHGGLTYSEASDCGNYWIVGFDTAHSCDNKDNWAMSRVLNETLELQKKLDKE